MLRVGQKVVCINNRSTTNKGRNDELTKGAVYTVEWVGISPLSGEPSVHLIEVPDRRGRSPLPGLSRVPFNASRFRPIVERKTDISIFTAMLNPSKEYAR